MNGICSSPASPRRPHHFASSISAPIQARCWRRLTSPRCSVAPAPLKALPPPSPSHATVTLWQPGRMSVTLDPAPLLPSYLLIAENWYPDWEATTDGRPAPCLRGDYSLITVPLASGTKTVELSFRSKLYERGRALTLGSLGLLVIAAAGSLAAGRRRRA